VQTVLLPFLDGRSEPKACRGRLRALSLIRACATRLARARTLHLAGPAKDLHARRSELTTTEVFDCHKPATSNAFRLWEQTVAKLVQLWGPAGRVKDWVTK